MSYEMQILIVGLIVLVSHTLEGITGFGCTVIALPFMTLVLGLKTSVQLLCLQALIMAIFIVARSWRSIKLKEFLYIVLFVGLGMPIGMLMFSKMSPVVLSVILGMFMIGVGIHGTNATWKSKACIENMQPSGKKSWFMSFILFLGGIIHGAFGTGGPFVVIYASRVLIDKSLFRVTLSLLWLVLNSIRLVGYAQGGMFSDNEIMKAFYWNMPFLLVGVFLGDWLHRKSNALYFRLCLYIVLSIAGSVMFLSNLFKLINPQ